MTGSAGDGKVPVGFAAYETAMIRTIAVICLLLAAGCTGRAWNTSVADDPAVRVSIVDSVRIGVTTETAFVTRWGRPVQILREGAQTTYIYRNVAVPGEYLLRYGNSAEYVIVDFQYGVAVNVRTSDAVGCRATFPPLPSGYQLDNPSTVHPVNCPSVIVATAPVVGQPVDHRRGGIVTK